MRSGVVKAVPVPSAEKRVLRHLMQAYLHDLSEFTGEVPGTDGRFNLSQFFELYWVEETRYPFRLEVDGGTAGFALVREIEPGLRSIAEFFVLRSYRGSGVGRAAAFVLFDRFPGRWRVAQDAPNIPAQRFWRSVIGEYTAGDFVERVSRAQPAGPEQWFTTRALG